jgi:hypothetical protein
MVTLLKLVTFLLSQHLTLKYYVKVLFFDVINVIFYSCTVRYHTFRD